MIAAGTAHAAFVAGDICRLALAAIFFQSAWQALRDPATHAQAIAGYRLLPNYAVTLASRMLPALNATAAALLIAPPTSQAGARLGAALITVFTAAIFINLRRGRLNIECGCGGAHGQRISAGLVMRNLTLLGLVTVAFHTPARGRLDAATFIGIAGGAGGVVALYFTASQLLANSAIMRAVGMRA